MLTANQIADYFLKKNQPEFGDAITNLKIQKLVYYAQGFHLAMYNVPFFEDDILAWEHGPVVESLYYKYRDYGASEIPVPESVDLSIFTTGQIELLDEVLKCMVNFLPGS